MSDLSQLLYGATVDFDGNTIGQVVSANGNFITRDTPQFNDCDNGVARVLTGRYAYGELNVQAVLNSGSAGDLSQLLLGSAFAFNSQACGQVISVGGTFLTRNTAEFSDCANDAKTVLVGTCSYGPINVQLVYDPTATTGVYAVLAGKAVNATPTGAAVFTLGDGMILTAATAVLTNLDLPGAGGDSDRLVTSLTAQPVSGSAWVISGTTGVFATLATAVVAADPTGTCTFTLDDGSKVEADVSVITRLDFPSAGSESDRVTQSLSIRPVNGGKWTFTGKAA